MKHKLLVFLVCFMATSTASAADFNVDGIYYNVLSQEDMTCEVTSKKSRYTYAVMIPSTVTYNGKRYSVTKIGNGAFWWCYDLTSVTIPTSVKTIGDRAFMSCTSLTTVEIPNSVTEIGNSAFGNCSNLTSLLIPNSVTKIGSSAFSGCSSLTTMEIPASVTAIGFEAFQGCKSLKAFYGKFASADHRCLILDGTLLSFAPAELTSYTIPSSVKTIGNSVFVNCTSMTTVEIPSSVSTIGNSVFSSCSSLASVVIPNSVTEIGDAAFYDCSTLSELTIGKNVQRMGSCAFANCSMLKEIKNLAKVPPIANVDTFTGSNKTGCMVLVPLQAIPLYKGARGWDYFKYIQSVNVGMDADVNNDGVIDVADVVSVYSQMAEDR